MAGVQGRPIRTPFPSQALPLKVRGIWNAAVWWYNQSRRLNTLPSAHKLQVPLHTLVSFCFTTREQLPKRFPPSCTHKHTGYSELYWQPNDRCIVLTGERHSNHAVRACFISTFSFHRANFTRVSPPFSTHVATTLLLGMVSGFGNCALPLFKVGETVAHSQI